MPERSLLKKELNFNSMKKSERVFKITFYDNDEAIVSGMESKGFTDIEKIGLLQMALNSLLQSVSTKDIEPPDDVDQK